MRDSENIIHVTQGHFHVSRRPGDVLATVLGSCVAACVFDPGLGIGGMNHFLLPGSDPGSSNNVKYGAHSMEQLINALLRSGAIRSRIEVQLFGGGNVVKGIRGVGSSNAEFARRFVLEEGLKLTRWELGGQSGRRVRFYPATGRADVSNFPVQEPTPPKIAPRPAANAGSAGAIELF